MNTTITKGSIVRYKGKKRQYLVSNVTDDQSEAWIGGDQWDGHEDMIMFTKLVPVSKLEVLKK